MKTTKTLRIIALGLMATASAPAVIVIQPYTYFSTATGFGDGKISVFDGDAKWSGVTDSTGATSHSGVFGDGTVLDYRFVGSKRTAPQAFVEHANGGGAYLTSAFTVGTLGNSGSANTGLDVWYNTNPDNLGTFDTTPDSDAWLYDHVAGGDQIRGVVDVSQLSSARIYFIYGSFDNAATINLGTIVAGNDLGILSIPASGPDDDRLVIQEVTIDNSGADHDIIHFNYSATNTAGRGRFAGVIIDGVAVPEPSSMLLLGLGSLALLRRRR